MLWKNRTNRRGHSIFFTFEHHMLNWFEHGAVLYQIVNLWVRKWSFWSFLYSINNNKITENGVLLHFTLKNGNEIFLSKMLKNKILDSLLLQDDFTSSQRLAPVSSSWSASQLKGLPTTLAPTLPATRPPQVPPLAIDDIGLCVLVLVWNGSTIEKVI